MNAALLLTLATELGAPLLQKILAGRIGQSNSDLITQVVARIADAVGVRPSELGQLATKDPATVRDAIMSIEAEAPELLAIHAQGLEFQMAQVAAESGDPVWMRAWRPAGMYLIGFLWLWTVVILHSLNAAFKIALPPIPWPVLLQVTGIYAGLYMGGHTIKDMVGKWAAKNGGN